MDYKLPFIKLLSYIDFIVTCPLSPNSVTPLYCVVFMKVYIEQAATFLSKLGWHTIIQNKRFSFIFLGIYYIVVNDKVHEIRQLNCT